VEAGEQLTNWLSGAEMRDQLIARSADPVLREELEKLTGQTLDEL
jgi:hypothetical protein